MKIPAFARPLALACGASVCIAACGASGDKSQWSPARLLSHDTHAAAVHNAAKPAVDRDMVTAVISGKSGVPVEVKFALRQRPEIGKPTELDLELTPSAPLDRLIASFHADSGLGVIAGGEPASHDRPEPGLPIPHALMIVPQHDGIFYVTATVLAEFGGESVARTFTIPVIAGTGAP